MTANAYACRRDFVINYGDVRNHTELILESLLDILDNDPYTWKYTNEYEKLGAKKSKNIYKNTLYAWYALTDDNAYDGYHNHHEYEHQECEKLDKIYSVLEKLGYTMSAEEKALKDGTHELFGQAEDDNGE